MIGIVVVGINHYLPLCSDSILQLHQYIFDGLVIGHFAASTGVEEGVAAQINLFKVVLKSLIRLGSFKKERRDSFSVNMEPNEPHSVHLFCIHPGDSRALDCLLISTHPSQNIIRIIFNNTY
eukprot:sb/3475984/